MKEEEGEVELSMVFLFQKSKEAGIVHTQPNFKKVKVGNKVRKKTLGL